MVKKTILAFAALTAMTAADLFKKAGEKSKISDAVVKAKDKLVDDLKEFAKVVAAMKRLYTTRLENHELPGDTSFKQFWKANAKGELPGRAEALAGFFNAMVLTIDGNGNPLIPEAVFDDAMVDWLEKANPIINAVRKAHGENWKGHDDVLDVINALTKPGDAGKKLKEIRERQKGDKAGTATVEAPALTAKMAAAFLLATIQQAAKASKDAQYELCCYIWELNGAWNELPGEITREHDARYEEAAKKGVAPHLTVVTSAAQNAEPGDETPEAGDEQNEQTDETQTDEQPMAAAA